MTQKIRILNIIQSTVRYSDALTFTESYLVFDRKHHDV